MLLNIRHQIFGGRHFLIRTFLRFFGWGSCPLMDFFEILHSDRYPRKASFWKVSEKFVRGINFYGQFKGPKWPFLGPKSVFLGHRWPSNDSDFDQIPDD